MLSSDFCFLRSVEHCETCAMFSCPDKIYSDESERKPEYEVNCSACRKPMTVNFKPTRSHYFLCMDCERNEFMATYKDE